MASRMADFSGHSLSCTLPPGMIQRSECPEEVTSSTWDRCYDFLNIFAKKFCNKWRF
jgi:hypothetical protein